MFNSKPKGSVDQKTRSVEEVVLVRRALGVEAYAAKDVKAMRPSSHKQMGLMRTGETVQASPIGRPRSSVHPMQVNVAV